MTEAYLKAEGEMLLIHSKVGQTLGAGQIGQVAVSPRLGNTPRYLQFPDGTFETCENQAIDDVFRNRDTFSKILHKFETSLLLVGAGALLVAAFIFGFTTYVIPSAAKTVSHSIPHRLVTEAGHETLRMMDELYFEPTSLTLREQERIRGLLAPHLDYESITLHFRKWYPNALALPDQSIVITDSLAELMNDKELVAIAYHELGHLEERHLVRRSLQASATSLLLFLLTSNVNNIDLLVAIPSLLADLAYSRSFEREADLFALKKMKENNVDPIHLAEALVKLESWYSMRFDRGESNEGLNYLSTHPAPHERILFINNWK